MDYITVKEAAEKWQVTPRRVQFLCSQNRIKGTYRFGKSWMIPSSAVLPNANARLEEPTLPMPRKSPFLDMTNLYNSAGRVEECAEMLVNHREAYALFKAQVAYRRGDIDRVYEQARFFLSAHSGFYAILGGGMLLAQCAIWRGDFILWKEAKKHIFEAPCKDEHDREMVSLALAIIDSSVYDNKDYPEWFKIGNFEQLHGDSHPAAKVFYIKYLYMSAYEIATGLTQREGMQGLSLMKLIPNAIEPMISQAVIDQTVVPEIYLRMSCAVAYYNSGRREKALAHMDKAIALALPDGLYGLLTEYVRHFGELLERRIAMQDEHAVLVVKELYNIYNAGWTRLSSQIRDKYVPIHLNSKEREIAKLTAFGFTAKEIAGMMYLSESTVNHDITRIVNRAGLVSKKEFAYIL